MTDKQIIIDGVDISKCEYYWIFEEACMSGRWKSTINYLCKDNPDCLYKQLKRLKAELDKKEKTIKSLDEMNSKLRVQIVAERCETIEEFNMLQSQYNAVVEQNRQLQRESKKIINKLWWVLGFKKGR